MPHNYTTSLHLLHHRLMSLDDQPLPMSSDNSPEQDALVNDVSRQMAASQLSRRLSRSSGSQSGHRPARVEKPRSIHNSPRSTAEWRKTTIGTKRYATLDDHYNMMFGLGGGEDGVVEDRREPSRPVSWHPSSTHPHGHLRTSGPGFVQNQARGDWVPQSAVSRGSGFGSEFDSVSARSSVYQESNARISTAQTDSSWQDARLQMPPNLHASNTHTDGQVGPTPWYLQNWARMVQAQTEHSRSSSTEFLPIQHPSGEEDRQSRSAFDDDESEDDDGDLVGMGLYDPPEGTHTWQSSTLVHGTGKGLKLEETWQPPPEQEEDEDDASSYDGSVDEPPAKEDDHWSLKASKDVPANMEGKSFFFDDDETYTKEWWFQQLKQPTAQDAGLGYGWL